MKVIFLTLALIFSTLATSASADMIVINGRYIVAKTDIRGYFYRESERTTVFDIRWRDWSTQYRCQDPYEEAKVEAASLNFVLQIAEARSLDFQDFLDGEGFTDCAKF